jgi:hypothetical protein
MNKKIGILILHGIGENNPDFADGMIIKMNKCIKSSGFNPDEIAYQSCCWDTVMQPIEQKLWDKINIYNDLSYIYLRKFCVNALSDAVSYQESFGRHGGIYDTIHNYIHESLKELKNKLGENSHLKPLIIMSHSFGCYVMSDYIWDKQHNCETSTKDNDFVNMKTLTGIITSGCNIPFFTVAYDDIQAIDLPCKDSKMSSYSHLFKWYNYYDKNDVIGMPLKGLSDSYNKVVTEDIKIKVGSILTSWNPMNHLYYREDSNFVKPVCKYICELLKVKGQ